MLVDHELHKRGLGIADSPIGAVAALKVLDLSSNYLIDVDTKASSIISALEANKALTHLNLNCNPDLEGDKAIQVISQLTSLTELHLNGVVVSKDKSIEALSRLSSLTSLSLAGTGMTDSKVQKLSEAFKGSGLKHLDLSQVGTDASGNQRSRKWNKISDSGAKALIKKLEQLRNLNLNNNNGVGQKLIYSVRNDYPLLRMNV